jgi:predicted RNA-binding protein with TRAM domain
VKFGDITLTEGKDYSIEITSTDDSGDGTSAGINAGKATITLNGKGNYSGTTTANYTIGKVPMKKVTLSGTQFTYNGALQKPGVKFGDITLTEGKDGTSAGINAGKVTITFNSKGNYSGTTTANYTIAPASITGVTVKLNPASFTFDGNSHIPAVTASFGNTDLTEDVDYSAQITSADGSGTSAGTNAGTVTITLNGKGNYSGTTTTNYTIGKVSMSNVTISDTPLTYSGAEQTPEVTFNGTTLKKDKDYSIEITSTDDSGDGTSAGTNAGTVSITLTGKGNYSGTTTANYTIGKVPMNNVTISDTPLTYSGAEQTPEVTYNGNTLKKDKDYSVKITSTDDSGDGTSAGTNAGTVSITVTGKGNYTGTKTAAYTISKVPLTITNATVSNKAYDGTVAATVGSVTLSGFINNETLTFNQDYTVSGTFSDAQIGTNKQVLVTVTMLNTAKANHYAVPGVYVCRANIHNDRSSYDDNTNTGTALPALLTDAATGVEADISGAAFPMSVNGVTLSTTRPKISGASADPQGAAAYQLAVSSTALNIVGSPSLYSIKLLNQNGSTISSFTGSVIVKLPVPVGIHGTPRVFRREPDGTFTDMNAKVENGYLVFRTTHFSYYIVAGTGDSITLDTKSYEMPLGGEYRIGVKQTGKKNVALKVRSTNSGVAAARLANGSVQVNGTGVGTAWIILDVFDDKNKLLAHVSTRIDVKTGIRPRGDSTRQIVAYTVRDTADSLTLDTKSYELTIGGKYQIGAWLTGGKAVTVRYYSANNKIASVTKLPNGNYQVTGNRKGTTWIMFDVYDSKNEFLTHASTHIDVKDGVHPNGNSAKQIGVF